MLNELRPTVDPIAFEELRARRIAERIPNHTARIMEVLEGDKNKDVHKILSDFQNKNPKMKIGLEDLGKEICFHVYDEPECPPQAGIQKNNEFVVNDNMDDSSCLHVSEQTMKDLKSLCADYRSTREDVDTQLDDAY